jgi:hypothetical protein
VDAARNIIRYDHAVLNTVARVRSIKGAGSGEGLALGRSVREAAENARSIAVRGRSNEAPKDPAR